MKPFKEIRLYRLIAGALGVPIAAFLVLGCATPAPSQSANSPRPSPTIPTSSPVPTQTEAPSTTTSTDAALIAAARDYAARAKIQLDPNAQPLVGDEAAIFDPGTLRAVSLVRSDSTLAKPRLLRVYFDDAAVIRVVESGSAFATGSISRADAIARAIEELRLSGHDPADGTVEVTLGQPGQEWFITFSRSIGGYPVSNYPMAWGPDGDKAYLNLRATGELNELYYIRPSTVPPGALPSTTELNSALDIAMKAFGQGPRTPAPGQTVQRRVTWIRPNLPSFPSLVLSYCESAQFAGSGWSAICIDPSTGRIDLSEGGAD